MFIDVELLRSVAWRFIDVVFTVVLTNYLFIDEELFRSVTWVINNSSQVRSVLTEYSFPFKAKCVLFCFFFSSGWGGG